jgi:hypothetical protein
MTSLFEQKQEIITNEALLDKATKKQILGLALRELDKKEVYEMHNTGVCIDLDLLRPETIEQLYILIKHKIE